VVTVAMHRLPPAVKIPAKLLRFRREEWMAPDDRASWGYRFGVVTLHGMHRSKHIHSELGDMLDESALKCG
jgi:hypothetical protein